MKQMKESTENKYTYVFTRIYTFPRILGPTENVWLTLTEPPVAHVHLN